MQNPFSVVISVYKNDNAKYFYDALNSIIQQSVVPSEIVIVVDGPVGNDISTVLALYSSDPRVRIIKLVDNLGLGAARHIAVQACKNELITVMDADDIAVPERFALQLKEFEANNVDVVGGQIEEFTSVPGDLNRFRRVPLSDFDIKKRNRWRQAINHVSIMFKRDAYLRAGGYRSLAKVEDWDLTHRMIVSGSNFKNIPKTLVHVRSNDEQFHRRQGLAYLKEELHLFREMRASGYINDLQFMINCSIRCFSRLLPARFLVLVYKLLLR